MQSEEAAAELSRKLCGAWSLIEWISVDLDGKEHFPFGQDALGSLHYVSSAQRGGIMIAQLSARQRPPLVSDTASAERAQKKCDAFDSYVAYSGLWRVDGDCVIHRVESSLYPNWVGTDLLRRVRFRDDTLILTTVPQSRASVTHQLSWRRA